MQLIVLGMHRSGTSVLMRLLNLMGVYFGPEGISTGANSENPKGFWERQDVRALNDMVLHSTGCDWDRVLNFDLAAVPPEALTEFRKRAARIVLELDAHRPWAIKEPRLCLLLPLWRSFLEAPLCVHIHRHPLEVASSLKHRNGVALPAGLALWERYVTAAARHASEIPALFVSHRRLMLDPVDCVAELLEGLISQGVQGLRMPSKGQVRAFVSDDLYRERADRVDLVLHADAPQIALFEQLEAGEGRCAAGLAEFTSASAASLAEYEATLPLVARRMPGVWSFGYESAGERFRQLEKDIKSLRETTTKVTNDLKHSGEAIRGLESEIRALEDQNRQDVSRGSDGDVRIQALESQLNIEAEKAARARIEIEGRDTRILALQQEIESARKHGSALESEAATARAQLSIADADAGDVAQLMKRLRQKLAAAEDLLTGQDAKLAEASRTIAELQAERASAAGIRQDLELRIRDGEAAARHERDLLYAEATRQEQARAQSLARADGLLDQLQAAGAALEASRLKQRERFAETELLTRMLMEKDSEIDRLAASAVLKDAETVQLKASLDTKAAEAKDLSHRLDANHRQTVQLVSRLAQINILRDRLSAKDSEAAQLAKQVERLHARLAAMESSTSWKWTAPCRSLATVFGRHPRQARISKNDLELIRRSSWFDAKWYLGAYPDVAAGELDPASHYLLYGANEGRNPGPNFDTRRYLADHQDVSDANMNPLIHFIRHGQIEGRALKAVGAQTKSNDE